MKNCILIADYCIDPLTPQELRSALLGHLSGKTNASISFVHSTPNTIHTTYLLKQILLTEERLGDANNTVIFVNTDARIQTSQGVEKAKGAQFVVLRMKSGAFVCGPNAGYSFSLVRNDIEYVYHYKGLDKGTQFRSRELYMRVCALLMEGKEDEMDLDEIRNNDIPELEGFHVGHVDNYGNIKTTIPHSYMKGKHTFGDEVSITIGKKTQKAVYTHNMFGHKPDALVIAPGSSGIPDDPYLEAVVWQHLPLKSGKLFFPDVVPGDIVTLR